MWIETTLKTKNKKHFFILFLVQKCWPLLSFRPCTYFQQNKPHMKFAAKQNMNYSSIPNEKFEIPFLFTEYDIRKKTILE